MTQITLFDNSRKDKYLLTNDLLKEVKEQNDTKFSYIKAVGEWKKTENLLNYKRKVKLSNNDCGIGKDDRPYKILQGFESKALISRFGIGLLIDGYVEIDEDQVNNAIKNFLINLANDNTYLTKLQDLKIEKDEKIANLEANESEEHSNNREQINKLKKVLKSIEDRIIEENKIVNKTSPFNLNNDWDKYLNIAITRKEDGSELTINFNNLIKLDDGYIASVSKSLLASKLEKILEDSIYNDFSIKGKNDRLEPYEKAIISFNGDELTVAEDGLTITESRVEKIDDEPISFPDMYKIKQPITINKEIKDKYISFINEYKFLLESGEVEYEACCNQYEEKLSDLNKLFTDMNNLGYDTTKIEEDIEEINDKLSIIHTIQKEIEELNTIQKEILEKDNTIDSYRTNLNNHIKRIVEDNKVKSDELKEVKEDYKLLDEAYSEIEEEKDELEDEIVNANDTIKSRDEEIVSINEISEKNIASLNTHITTIKDELTKSNDTIKSRDEEIVSINEISEKNIASLNTHITTIKDELTKSNDTIKSRDEEIVSINEISEKNIASLKVD